MRMRRCAEFVTLLLATRFVSTPKRRERGEALRISGPLVSRLGWAQSESARVSAKLKERRPPTRHFLNQSPQRAVPEAGAPRAAVRSRLLGLILFAVSTGWFHAPAAHAFVVSTDLETGAPLRWRAPDANAPTAATNIIRFHLTTDAFSTTNAARELNAIRAAFGQWQSIPGTALRFDEGAIIPSAADLVDPTDGTNVVYWATTPALLNNGTISLRGALGLTVTSARADGTLVGADIILNGFEHAWFTEFSDKKNPAFFAETTLLHEIGHLLGLDHSPIGGTTMSPIGGPGVDARHGLSPDELAFARATYGDARAAATLGHLAGRVLMEGSGVFGAAVGLEDSAGNLVGATVSGAGGKFIFNAVPPGTHQLRVWPLDPATVPHWLIRGADLGDNYYRATTFFQPTANQPITIAANQTNTLDVAVTAGPPSFRIAFIRQPAAVGAASSLSPLPAQLSPGQSNILVGVYSPDLPLTEVTLRITGDGLTLGATQPQAPLDFGGGLRLQGLIINVSVATNATSGLRSFVVQHGTNLAYANGYVKILPTIPDHNFDGLDDNFQRRYFPVFTAAEAAPNADPDGDGITNAQEAIAGTDPTNAQSFFGLDRVTQTAAGTVIEWKSFPGKRYQVFTKTEFGPGPWTPIGSPVTATSATAQFHDPAATHTIRFYRLQVIP